MGGEAAADGAETAPENLVPREISVPGPWESHGSEMEIDELEVLDQKEKVR